MQEPGQHFRKSRSDHKNRRRRIMTIALLTGILITNFFELCVLSAIYGQGEKENATENN